MTRREMLIERYEEALFALLLDEVAEAEGQKILEEQTQLQPLITPEARERCRKVVARQTRQQETKRVTLRAGRIAARVAVIALVLMLLMTTAFATIPAVREKVSEVVIAVLSDRTSVSLSTSEMGTSAPPKLRAEWIPDGFTLQSEGREEMSVWRQYVNENGDMISVYALDLQGGNMSYDTEAAPMESINLNGHDAYLINDGEVIQFIWNWVDNPAWLVTVTTKGLDFGTALRVTENVVMDKVKIATPTEKEPQTDWLPMGFSLVDEGETAEVSWNHYEGRKDGFIETNIYHSDREDFAFSLDTENGKTEDVELCGYPATVIIKDDEVHVVCHMEEFGFVLHVRGENVRKAAVLRVAENMKLMQVEWEPQNEPLTGLEGGEGIVTWVPNGFAFFDGFHAESYDREMYVNGENAYAEVYVYYGNIVKNIDTEGAVIEEIELNGHSAMLATKGKKLKVLCVMEEEELILYIRCEHVSREDVLRIAESVDVF